MTDQASPSTPCELSRRFVLDAGWSQADRQQAGSALAHIASCAECSNSVAEFDRVRSLLRQGNEPAGGHAPTTDWIDRALKNGRRRDIRLLRSGRATACSAFRMRGSRSRRAFLLACLSRHYRSLNARSTVPAMQ